MKNVPYEIVVIGASFGGLSALQILLPEIAADFPLPIVIVQHRGKYENSGLCEFLRRHSSLPLDEPDDKEEIEAGRVYLAPRDYHLLIERGHFALSTEAAVSYARPSIDVLFESAVEAYKNAVVGLILTGANADGAQGLAQIKAHGGLAIVQDPSSAEARAMPEAAIAATAIDCILPISEIAPFLNQLCRQVSRSSYGM